MNNSKQEIKKKPVKDTNIYKNLLKLSTLTVVCFVKATGKHRIFVFNDVKQYINESVKIFVSTYDEENLEIKKQNIKQLEILVHCIEFEINKLSAISKVSKGQDTDFISVAQRNEFAKIIEDLNDQYRRYVNYTNDKMQKTCIVKVENTKDFDKIVGTSPVDIAKKYLNPNLQLPEERVPLPTSTNFENFFN